MVFAWALEFPGGLATRLWEWDEVIAGKIDVMVGAVGVAEALGTVWRSPSCEDRLPIEAQPGREGGLRSVAMIG